MSFCIAASQSQLSLGEALICKSLLSELYLAMMGWHLLYLELGITLETFCCRILIIVSSRLETVGLRHLRTVLAN